MSDVGLIEKDLGLFKQLPRPPIQEAIVDFRVSYQSPPERKQFDALSAALGASYPKRDDLNRHSAMIQFEGSNSQLSQATAFAGVRFQSADELFVLQAQVGGFTLSRLRPYSKWEDLLLEAKKTWNLFQEHLHPQSVQRIACRYINRFDLPSGPVELGEFVVNAPEIPEELPQGLSRYFLQQEIPVPDIGAVVLLTQILEPETPSTATIVLDIDAFKVASYETVEQAWWDDLEALRQLKNRFFFKSVTEKTLELFK